MNDVRLLVLAGSTREGSYNKLLAKQTAKLIQDLGAQATLIDLADYRLPLYDGDEEQEKGFPFAAAKLKNLFLEHDGVIFASPEYNASITGVLKNTIDWLSRSSTATPDNSAFINRQAMFISTSLGGLGGLRALTHLRDVLTHLQMHIFPQQLAIPFASKAFSETGELIDQNQQQLLASMLQKFIGHIAKLKFASIESLLLSA